MSVLTRSHFNVCEGCYYSFGHQSLPQIEDFKDVGVLFISDRTELEINNRDRGIFYTCVSNVSVFCTDVKDKVKSQYLHLLVDVSTIISGHRMWIMNTTKIFL